MTGLGGNGNSNGQWGMTAHLEHRLTKVEVIQGELIRRIAYIERRQDENSDHDHSRDDRMTRQSGNIRFIAETLKQIKSTFGGQIKSQGEKIGKLQETQFRLLVGVITSVLTGLGQIALALLKYKLGL